MSSLNLSSSALFLVGSSMILFVVVLIVAGHNMSGFPTSSIGLRRHGVIGYDAILGCFPPHFQLMFHTSYLLLLEGLFLLTLEKFVIRDSLEGGSEDGIHNSLVLPPLLFYIVFYFTFIVERSQTVSKPGPPRRNKLKSTPQFDRNKDHSWVASNDTNWMCVVGPASHELTKGQHGELTGEAAGRQIWAALPTSCDKPSLSAKEEEWVQQMASGGRGKYGVFCPFRNPNSSDQIFRAQQIRAYLLNKENKPPSITTPKTPQEAAEKALSFYSMLLTEDGHWAGDYGGPHFLMPGIIVAWYILGKPAHLLSEEHVDLMKHYLLVHQQADGGWGTHIESPSTMFGTVLCYVSLRLLGVNKRHLSCTKASRYIKKHKGALYTSSWAKFYLCLLGLMDWRGTNPVPPELWLMPNWTPFHPSRMWCHARMVYLPMGYLYGVKFVYPLSQSDPLIQQIKEEIYVESYDSINWDQTRHWIAPQDNYSPIPTTMKFLQNLLVAYECIPFIQPLRMLFRRKGLDFCLRYMQAEDLQTNYVNIGPVNKVLNLLGAFHASSCSIDSAQVRSHILRVPDYLWVAEDGMKMQGYNGSQCWDTSFAIQAVAECHLLDKFPQVSTKVYSYLEKSQILSTEPSKSSAAFTYESPTNRLSFYRHVSQGGWPFSTSAHGWPISDCTSEGIKAVLTLLNKCNAVRKGIKDGLLPPFSKKRLDDAIHVLLTLQNEDGGWATYENNRGFGWYEQLNPSEVFGDIMIDYSYVECSSASISALADFLHHFPDTHQASEIKNAIKKGRVFIQRIQRHDGSWYGSWACCFCYGCWFGIEGLIAAGEKPSSSMAIKRCVKYLLKYQRTNGGWGEDFTSCYDKSYAADGMSQYGDHGSGVVNTAWALLALAAANCSDLVAIRRGVQYLMSKQLPSGDWPQEGIAGVFNRACGITYTAYRNVFPMWALGRCATVYGNDLLLIKPASH